jgi:hypothetical protein
VAAKAIAEEFYHLDGDDAFVAGLMDDIGMLAMLGQMGQPYARFLEIVWKENADVRRLERASLGFDHAQVTAALLSEWKMPPALVSAVTAAGEYEQPILRLSAKPLAQILYLSRLTASLVGQHRFDVLPDLLEYGTAFCGLNKLALNSLLLELEPKVSELAAAMDVPVSNQGSYAQILSQAHARLAELGEELAGPLARLEHAEQLLVGIKEQWTQEGAERRLAHAGPRGPDRSNTRLPQSQAPGPHPSAPSRPLLAALERAIRECRSCRDELAVALVGASELPSSERASMPTFLGRLSEMLRRTCRARGIVHVEEWPAAEHIHAVVLPHCSRHDAVELVRDVLNQLQNVAEGGQAPRWMALSAGVAAVDTPGRNFDPARLVDSAERCRFAAEACGAPVKSIEIS